MGRMTTQHNIYFVLQTKLVVLIYFLAEILKKFHFPILYKVLLLMHLLGNLQCMHLFK